MAHLVCINEPMDNGQNMNETWTNHEPCHARNNEMIKWIAMPCYESSGTCNVMEIDLDQWTPSSKRWTCEALK